MRKYFIIFLLLLFSASMTLGHPGRIPTCNANPEPMPEEGMWIPLLVKDMNYQDMVKLGLKLTAEQIFSINNASLKDAIIIFGGGCTGEIVSDKGLIFTNHHCGYGAIQALSSVDHDYLANGFWAKSLNEELPAKGLTVKFLLNMKDVSTEILSHLENGMSSKQRTDTIQKYMIMIEKEAKGSTSNVCQVRSFFGGNAYYLFVYEEYTDIRLVGTPPSSIGKFGADTDNWMWPRHTGDFSIFRVYAGTDGKPAPYSKDNVPMKPKHYLPVSLKGVKKGDFAMIMGNPGRTERYLTSWGIKLALDKRNPSIVKIRTEKLKLMLEDMNASDAIRIKYASKYASIANYWKYYQGQSKGLIRNDVYNKKLEIEKQFQNWLTTKDAYMMLYGNVLEDFEKAYSVLDKYEIAKRYFQEAIWSGGEVVPLSAGYRDLFEILNSKTPDAEKMNKETTRLKGNLEGFFKDYNLATDKKIFCALLKMYFQDVPKDQQPAFLTTQLVKFKNDFEAYTDFVYSKSMFPYKEKLNAFLNEPSLKVLSKDPVYLFMKAFFDKYIEINSLTMDAQNQLNNASRLFINGLMIMQKDKKFYPDANSTMRITYGTVQDYFPGDAMHYQYYTTLEGVMQKEDPDNWEFVVPAKLKELYNTKDYGRYGDVDQAGNKIMKVCFLTTHDITGGNSGSPVMDAEGNLIGLAFDGNWEAMSGDINYEPQLQRTINVDIRYVLFIIDKFAGATNIIDELKIIQ